MLYKIKNKFKSLQNAKNSDNFYINYVCQETGWSYQKAKKAMDRAKQDGFSYKFYAKRKIWTRTDKEYAQAVKNIQITNERNKKEKAHYITEIAKATGWSESQITDNVRAAKLICGCSYKDYCIFRLFEKTPEEQQTYLTLGVAEALTFKYNSDPEKLKTLLYKGRFAEMYADFFNRSWFINRDLSYETFLTKIDGVEDLILKPVSSTQGKGIEKIHCGRDVHDKKSIYDYIMAIPRRMICEECIVQHPDIAAFNQSSVNTVRVLTIVKDGVCHHVYAGFRMGRGKIVDNFHAGGIIATVDVTTGITCTDAVDLNGIHYPIHPVSGRKIQGFQIPHWNKILKITEAAALRLNGVNMVGWDIAVTNDNVCLIEGNSQASYAIIQLPYAADGIGMKKIFEPFL